jgi:hypothetical protein
MFKPLVGCSIVPTFFFRKNFMSNPTYSEKRYWSKLAELGCIACAQDGIFNPVVSIHHCEGRTKDGCHMRVLPLCAGHHQDGSEPGSDKIAVHPWKKRFEKKYGTQEYLMGYCNELLEVGD